ncbi:DUF885 domain-containing protein [Namhaeicola litoreus]|uniref:DUF885 domain-containing protein n=1 Tax=Namhaeicola litoreus TaxID=1052145 RepID=A0ABW3Y126_9FLAO
MSRTNIFLSTIALIGLFSCNSIKKEKEVPREISLDSLYLEYFNEQLGFDPVGATRLGYNEYNHLFANNISEPYLLEKANSYREWEARLKLLDTSNLDSNDKNEIAILKYLIKIEQEGLKLGIQPGTIFTYHPLHSYHRSTHHEFVKLAKGNGAQPFNSKQDYDDFLKRLKSFKEWLVTAQEIQEEAVNTDRTLPEKIVKVMIPQFDDWTSEDPKINPFYFSLAVMPNAITNQDSIEIVQKYNGFIKSELIPQFKFMQSYLEDVYLPKSKTEDGIYAISGGNEIYAYLVKYWSTTDITPQEVYEIGLQEVARIRKEMDSIKDATEFNGSLSEFFQFVNTDQQFFPFTTKQEIIAKHYETLEKIQPLLGLNFGVKPKTPFEVRPVPEDLANAATSNYDSPSMDGTRPGIFYEAIPDVRKFNNIAMEMMFLHEAIPGHHFQIALNLESDEIPLYRKIADFGAFTEGWGLYCESLGKELGLYKDPYQYLGRLQGEMLRAARLVVDPGLHYKGWTREQAIQYFLDNMPISEQSATVHIERYMVRPGQAISYKIGELKIKELRKRAEQQLGNKFILKDFHDLILTGGNVPLSILEDKVDEWIKKTGANIE